jgi:hypothetical protein
MSYALHKAALALLALTAAALSQNVIPAVAGEPPATLKVTSSAFQPDGVIPKKYSCDGAEVTPPLAWSDPPAGTKSFSLIMDDPDARPTTWVHWVLFDVPADARSLPENLPKTNELANGARQGVNGEPKIGYEGPCPPPGPVHNYHFKLYALDGKLGLKSGATKAEVEKAMKGHILAETQLVGRFGR